MENFNLPNLIVPVLYSTVRERACVTDLFALGGYSRTHLCSARRPCARACAASVRGDFRRNASSFFCSRGSYGAYECH